MNGYTIKTEPGVIPRYVVMFNGEVIGSHSSRAAAEAMRDSSAAARDEAPDDPFYVGFIECLYFVDTGEEGQPAADAEMSDKAKNAARRDCDMFQRDSAALLAAAYAAGDYDAVQAGRDFYFTRNGCGVGYWDRPQLKHDGIGERLSEAARNAGQFDIYEGDDGRIYA